MKFEQALAIFFLLMVGWLFTKNQAQDQELKNQAAKLTDLKQELSQAKQEKPSALQPEAPLANIDRLKIKLDALSSHGQRIPFQRLGNHVVIRFLPEQFFSKNQSVPTSEHEQFVEQIAQAMAELKFSTIAIRARSSAQETEALILSLKRAKWVAERLSKVSGVDLQKFDLIPRGNSDHERSQIEMVIAVD